jgi:hypothetical protein
MWKETHFSYFEQYLTSTSTTLDINCIAKKKDRHEKINKDHVVNHNGTTKGFFTHSTW